MRSLYNYQKVGVKTLRERKRILLCDSVGLGKTCQSLGAVTFPALIIAPSRATYIWKDEILIWLKFVDPINVYIYRGKPTERKVLAYDIKAMLRKRKDRPEVIVIATYAMMQELQDLVSIQWSTIIFDESHILRNRQRKSTRKTLYPTARKFKSERLYALTASPVVNGAQDLWTTLNMIDSKKFSSYWKFVNKYCVVDDNGFGQRISGTNPSNAMELKKLIQPYMLMRTANDVGLDLPDFRRQFISLDMTEQQKLAYRKLSVEGMLFLEDHILFSTETIVKFIRLRQLLVSPRLLDIDDDGAALIALRGELHSINEPIVIFTPFRAATGLIANVLAEAGYESSIIVGGMDAARIENTRLEFMNSRSTRKALIATLQMGTSWSAPGVALSYTVGFEWVPMHHEQSEGRLAGGLRRTVPVLSKYLVHNGTVDSHMRKVLNKKASWRDLALNARILLTPNEFL